MPGVARGCCGIRHRVCLGIWRLGCLGLRRLVVLSRRCLVGLGDRLSDTVEGLRVPGMRLQGDSNRKAVTQERDF